MDRDATATPAHRRAAARASGSGATRMRPSRASLFAYGLGNTAARGSARISGPPGTADDTGDVPANARISAHHGVRASPRTPPRRAGTPRLNAVGATEGYPASANVRKQIVRRRGATRCDRRERGRSARSSSDRVARSMAQPPAPRGACARGARSSPTHHRDPPRRRRRCETRGRSSSDRTARGRAHPIDPRAPGELARERLAPLGGSSPRGVLTNSVTGAAACERRARRRLRQTEPPPGLGDAALTIQRFECHEQIEIHRRQSRRARSRRGSRAH